MGGQDVVTDEAGDFREQLAETRRPGHVFGTDAVDPRVVEVEVVMVFRRTHQPGRFFDHYAAPYLAQPHRTR